MARLTILVLALALVLGCSTDPGITPLETVFCRATNEVSETQLLASVTALSGIHSRFMHWDPGNAATVTWLMETLAEQGSPAEADSFSYLRIRWIHTANVVSHFPGRTRPEDLGHPHRCCEAGTDLAISPASAADRPRTGSRKETQDEVSTVLCYQPGHGRCHTLREPRVRG